MNAFQAAILEIDIFDQEECFNSARKLAQSLEEDIGEAISEDFLLPSVMRSSIYYLFCRYEQLFGKKESVILLLNCKDHLLVGSGDD